MNGKCFFDNLCIGRLAIRCGNMKGSGCPKNQLPLEWEGGMSGATW